MAEPRHDARVIFLAALDCKTPEDRAALIGEKCGHDTDLRRRVEALLQAHDDPGDFLSAPAAAPQASLTAPAPQSAASEVGTLIAGRYKLLEKIGEGGMGSVWMADQREPIKRRLAVKLISAERGASRLILSRFEAERQAIALMDHPNIAKLLDAGTTEAGAPYFVMELVKGVPLTEFCDTHKLEIPERLALFQQICSAVQHAHQKGIIHRDLKPSNILVESHDGKAVPKVIDFGVAKATTGMQLSEHTLFTTFGHVMGTPLYMAPEQATFNALDVDTRADIYSLGAVLYELLTGTTPIESRRLKQVGMEEILRVIREDDAPTPSSRISTSQRAGSAAALRQIEPKKLGKTVKGELDWIVMKALSKERDRRYETANGFARDIERFLNHEPVAAGPPSAAYRLRKFVRRNRGQVIAASLVLFAMLAGVAGTTVGLFHAEHERQRAVANERRAMEAADAERQAKEREAEERAQAEKARDRTGQALDAMTSAITGDSLTTQHEISADQKRFLNEVLTYYREFAGETAGGETARARTAAAAFRVGLIEYRLGRQEQAVAAFRMARDGYSALRTKFPASAEYRRQLAGSFNNLGILLAELGKRTEAETQFRHGLAIQEKLAADFDGVAAYRKDVALSHNNLGFLLAGLGKATDAEQQYRRAVAIQQKLVNDAPTAPAYRSDLARSHNNLGNVLADLGKRSEAEVHHRIALALQEKLVAEHTASPEYRQDLGKSHNSLGYLLGVIGKAGDAQEQYRRALAIEDKLVAEFPGVPAYRFDLALSHTSLGNLLEGAGKRPEALEHNRKALAIAERLAAEYRGVPQYQIELGGSYCTFGNLARDHDRASESLDWFDRAIQTLSAVYEQDRRLELAGRYLRNSYLGRASAYDRLGKYAAAIRDWDRAIELSASEEQPRFRAARALTRANGGEITDAVAEAALLTSSPCCEPKQCYDLARVYAIAGGKDSEKKQAYGDRAMELLNIAVNAGFREVVRLKQDADLGALRDRHDFKTLVAELESGTGVGTKP
jgi:eukaryotic-like serine/threonine-protein kinase